jgi:hypothetical protein
MRIANRLVDLALTGCESDPAIVKQFFRVSGLIDPPTRLLRPSFLYRVAAANRAVHKRHSRDREGAAAAVPGLQA